MADNSKVFNKDWLGKTPAGWKKSKIKHLVSVRNESRVINDIDDTFIGPKNIEPGTGRILPYKQRLTAEVYDCCEQGDLLYTKIHPELCKATIAPVSSLCSGEFVVISRCDIDKRWLLYYMLTDEFTQAAAGTARGSAAARAEWNALSNLFIAYPEKAQMSQILDYLDCKCAEIDKAVVNLRKMISEYLSYKEAVTTEAVCGDSSDKKNWKTTKLKFVADVMPNRTTGKFSPEDEVPFVQVENVKEGNVDVKMKVFADIPYPFIKFYPGDILFAKLDNSFEIYSSGIVGPIPFGIGFGSPELFVIRCHDIDNRFLYYWLRNGKFRKDAFTSMYGTAERKRIHRGFLENYKIDLPPRDVQAAIADRLDRKYAQIDTVIAQCEEQIKTLLAYRKRLIFECVTGKIIRTRES